MEQNEKSTAHAALLGEILGDVGELYDEVKRLRDDLPKLSEDLTDRLKDRAQHLENAAQKVAVALTEGAQALDATAVNLGKQIDVYARASAAAEVDKAKASFAKAAETAASSAVEKAVAARLDGLATRLQGTITTLEHSTKTASRAVTWSGREKAAVFATTIVLSVVLSVAVGRFVPSSSPAPATVASLTEQQKSDMEGGKTMRLIYNALTPQEQAHLTKLAQTLPPDAH